jgi:hypothetical protein
MKHYVGDGVGGKIINTVLKCHSLFQIILERFQKEIKLVQRKLLKKKQEFPSIANTILISNPEHLLL